jgi:polyhydroxyalkanoate synthase
MTTGMDDLLERWAELWGAGMAQVWRSYTAAQEAIRATGRTLVGQTPARLVHAEGSLRLLRYLPQTETQRPIPVLCIPSLINHYYVMDLAPERSLAGALLRRGLGVYMLDWGVATAADRDRPLDEYITGLLGRCVEVARRESGADSVALLGYCMGGMMAAAYTVLAPDRVAALVNLAGPINYHDDGIYSVWTRPEYLDVDLLVDTLGNIPAELLNFTFHMVRPSDELLRALDYWERRDDPAFARTFAAMQLWTRDPTPFPGEAFRKYVKDLYQRNALMDGTFTVAGQPIDLARITAPTLTIAARRDHIAPWASVAVLHERVSSADKQLIVLESGHIGMVVGSDAGTQLWPQLGAWLAQRSN